LIKRSQKANKLFDLFRAVVLEEFVNRDNLTNSLDNHSKSRGFELNKEN
jgi:hypothetical protein